MSGEGTRPLKEMFKPRQVPEQTAAYDTDKTAATAAAHEPTTALTDIPAAAASTDFTSGGAAASGMLATPAPKVPPPATRRSETPHVIAELFLCAGCPSLLESQGGPTGFNPAVQRPRVHHTQARSTAGSALLTKRSGTCQSGVGRAAQVISAWRISLEQRRMGGQH